MTNSNIIKNFYDATAESYDKRHDNPTTAYMRNVEEKIIRKYAKGKILDIGCGTGHYLNLFENMVGLEISGNMAKLAGKKTGKKVVVSPAEKMPFSDESFDSVICMFSVLNVCDYSKTVGEIHRILKKDGIAVVSVTSLWDRYEKKLKNMKSVGKNVRIEGFRFNLHLFSYNDFMELFLKNGFEIKDFHSLFTMQRPYWGWYRNFTPIEKMKLKADYILPKKMGRIYIGIFRKY